jgi:hypothetical protein
VDESYLAEQAESSTRKAVFGNSIQASLRFIGQEAVAIAVQLEECLPSRNPITSMAEVLRTLSNNCFELASAVENSDQTDWNNTNIEDCKILCRAMQRMFQELRQTFVQDGTFAQNEATFTVVVNEIFATTGFSPQLWLVYFSDFSVGITDTIEGYEVTLRFNALSLTT